MSFFLQRAVATCSYIWECEREKKHLLSDFYIPCILLDTFSHRVTEPHCDLKILFPLYRQRNWGFPGGLAVKKESGMQEPQKTQVWPLGQKIPWRRSWQSTSSILPWIIPWTEEPGGLQSTGLQTVDRTEVTWHTDEEMKSLRDWITYSKFCN